MNIVLLAEPATWLVPSALPNIVTPPPKVIRTLCEEMLIFFKFSRFTVSSVSFSFYCDGLRLWLDWLDVKLWVSVLYRAIAACCFFHFVKPCSHFLCFQPHFSREFSMSSSGIAHPKPARLYSCRHHPKGFAVARRQFRPSPSNNSVGLEGQLGTKSL
jgi:hypothetical protein